MRTEQIPAEAAVVAAARALVREQSNGTCEFGKVCALCDCIGAPDGRDAYALDQARAALTAALPHLATHHPARVLPSVEDIEQRILPAWLAEHDARVRAEALREAAEALDHAARGWRESARDPLNPTPAFDAYDADIRQAFARWLRARAAETEGE